MKWQWNDEHETKLRQLWAEGLTMLQISEHFHSSSIFDSPSRCSVAGKVRRMGLNSRKGLKRPPKPVKPQTRRLNGAWRKPWHVAPVPDRQPVASIPSLGVCLLDLKEHHCRWPEGEGAAMLFCGNTALDKLPYCAGHYRMAYQLPVRRAAA